MNDCNFDILKENIRKRMSDKHMTQNDVAEALDTTQANIAKHLKKNNDAQTFTLKQVCQLADLFETSVDELLGRDTTSEKISVNNLCKFLAELIQRKILVPYEIHVDEQLDIETNFEFEDEAEYDRQNEKIKYVALYCPCFNNSNPNRKNYQITEIDSKILDPRVAISADKREINKFLNKFISSFSKFDNGLLDADEYDSIVRAYFEALKKLK